MDAVRPSPLWNSECCDFDSRFCCVQGRQFLSSCTSAQLKKKQALRWRAMGKTGGGSSRQASRFTPLPDSHAVVHVTHACAIPPGYHYGYVKAWHVTLCSSLHQKRCQMVSCQASDKGSDGGGCAEGPAGEQGCESDDFMLNTLNCPLMQHKPTKVAARTVYTTRTPPLLT